MTMLDDILYLATGIGSTLFAGYFVAAVASALMSNWAKGRAATWVERHRRQSEERL